MAAIIARSWRTVPPRGDWTLNPSNQFAANIVDVYPASTQLTGVVGGGVTAISGSLAVADSEAGLVYDHSNSSFTSIVSARTYTPALSQTIFAVCTKPVWTAGSPSRTTVVGGWTQSHATANDVPAGGNASLAMLGFYNNFGRIYAAACLTYSDGTSETVEPAAKVSAAQATSNPWFIAISYANASKLTLYGRDLTTGTFFREVNSKTKSLKQVSQPFTVFSSAPNADTDNSWAGRFANGDGSFIAFTNAALDRSDLNLLSSNPWQIFRSRPRRLYFGTAAAVGGTVFNPLSGRGGAAAQPLWMN